MKVSINQKYQCDSNKDEKREKQHTRGKRLGDRDFAIKLSRLFCDGILPK
jgi:hypothetical protein